MPVAMAEQGHVAKTNEFNDVKNGSLDDCVDPRAFPAWSYAELAMGVESRVVAIFHVSTPSGVVPYWFEDPDNQHRGLPLLKSMRPQLLGDYGSFLARGFNMRVFVALCGALNDLPDPLTCVQVIRWIDKRYGASLPGAAGAPTLDLRRAALQAVQAVTLGLQRRRQEFEQVMSYIMGGSDVPGIFAVPCVPKLAF